MSQLLGPLSDKIAVEQVIDVTAGASAATQIDADIIDMKDFSAVMFTTVMGPITAGAATSIKIEQGAVSDMSDGSDLEGSSITVADDDDGQVFIHDLFKPTKRYIRLVVLRATQVATVQTAIAQKYNPGSMKTTLDVTDLVTSNVLVEPDEGTA